jgi:hypothetical protein
MRQIAYQLNKGGVIVVTQFDPANLTLSEITKIQERVTAILGTPATLDQAVVFIQNNTDLVPAILGSSTKSEVTKTATAVATEVITKEVVPGKDLVKVDIYPVKSKTGNSNLWSHLPWEKWMDGNVHELRVSSQMSNSQTALFRKNGYLRANNANMHFSMVRKSRYSKYVYLQFTPK